MNTRIKVAAVTLSLIAAACGVQAAALTKSVQIAERGDFDVALKIKSNQVIYAGALVAVNTSATCENAADTSGLSCVGVSQQWVDMTGANYDSTKYLRIKTGTFRFSKSGTFTKADIGQFAYVKDNATVTLSTNTSNSVIAGLITDVDDYGVWVMVGALNRALAGNLTALDVSGNTHVGGTLGVAGASALTGAVTCASTLAAASLATTGAGNIGTTLGVGGASALTGAVTCASTLAAASLATTGAGNIGTTLGVGGASAFTGAVVCASTCASAGFKYNSTSGATVTFTNSPSITNIVVVQGGIITSVTSP